MRLVVEVDVAVRLSPAARLMCQVDCCGRCLDYWDLEQEAPTRTDYPLPTDWPSQGALEFRDVSMRYRPDPNLPLVLRGVSFSIQPGQKVR